ncbi:TMV resistance protein N [Vitis vinifera]|uniref:TMV resistance protein N n=1 Tax=Vitis vinifera TaxID=29760 RepID=A0A438FSJ9_VITVI|nr:TMV resistance protein N [Vitis vinifera]
MNKLRLLKIHQDAKYDHIMEIDGDVHFPQVALPKDLKLPSFELRYLHWDEYALKYLPPNFHPKNLVELNLRCGNIKQLWEGNKLLKKLKVINLNHSQHLMEFPSFSMMPNLEILTLEGCISLQRLPMDIDKLQHLQTLSCHDCSKLEHFPEIKYTMKNLKKLDLYGTAIEKLPSSSIEHLEGLEYLNLAHCENLVDGESREPAMLRGVLHLNSTGWLNCELPTLSGLSSLRVLHLNSSCITPRVIRSHEFLSSLEELSLSDCNVMERGGIPDYIYCLSSFQALDLSETNIHKMPAGIHHLSKLKFLGLGHCKQLQGSLNLPSSVRFLDGHDSFKSLSWQRWLWGFLFNCFKSEIQDVECRGGWHDIQFGQSGFFGKGISIVIPRMPHWISYQNVGNEIKIELPMDWFRDYLSFYSVCKCYCIGESSDQVWMTCYPQIAIQEKYRSNKWRQFTALFVGYGTGSFKNGELQEKLCLGETAINELLNIECLSGIQNLCLRNCKRLESLPSDIYKLKSLTISCSGCSKLQSFPEITEDMKILRELRLDGTSLKELPSSIQHLQGLQYLDLENCKNLLNIPDNICNLRSLKTLIVSGCSKLNKLPKNLGSLTQLQVLCAARLDSTSCQLPSLSDLRSLRILNQDRSNLVHGAIRSDISILYSLEEVDLSYCNLAEGGIPSEICYLSSLQALYLKGNHFSSIPSGISQLSKLKIIDLSHCEMLQQIPELPSSLRVLDAHGCIRLESLSSPQSLLLSSLFKCFKSEIQELECRMVLSSFFLQGFFYHGVNIVISESSGIAGGTWHQGSQVTMKLPWNWYENNSFLGFALCCAYSPLDNESEDGDGDGDGYPCTFKCWLTFWTSKFGWQWYLRASFRGYIHGRAVKVKKCAVHFLYSQGSSVQDTKVIKRSDYAQDDLADD